MHVTHTYLKHNIHIVVQLKGYEECLNIFTNVQDCVSFLQKRAISQPQKVKGRGRGRKGLAATFKEQLGRELSLYQWGLLGSHLVDRFSRIPRGWQ